MRKVDWAVIFPAWFADLADEGLTRGTRVSHRCANRPNRRKENENTAAHDRVQSD
jgi:hypothetical protein